MGVETVSSIYSAWDTADSAGSDLTGTMTADRASGPDIFSGQVNPVAAQPQGFAGVDYASTLGAPAPSPAAARLGGYQAQQQMQRQEQAPAFKSYKVKSDGSVAIETDQQTLADVFAQLTDLKQMKTAAMARVAQLQQQEASGSPLIDALSQISGHLAANDPTMPGWVRALGAANLQMGPQGIRRRREEEEAKVARLGTGIAEIGLQAEKLSEYRSAQEEAGKRLGLEERRVAVAEKAQAATELNQKLDNFRSDLRPVMDVVGRNGIFNADQEAAIRETAKKHPDLPPAAVEAEIAKAKGNAAARKAEIDRAAAAAKANRIASASDYASKLAAQEGKQIRGQVVRANLAQAGKMADAARIDEKEAIRLQGLNEMTIAADRMAENLANDPTWQGVIAGRVAETAKLTTAQQRVISDSADLFVKKMSSLGISFAKTSDAEMKKILATVPTATMTVGQAKRLLQILDDEGRRAAEFIAQRNWAEPADQLAAALPAKYRDAGVRAHAAKTKTLTPQQRLAVGLSTGDDELVLSEVERAIAGAPGGAPAKTQPQNSTRPGEIRMATPTTAPKDDPFGLKGFLPKR
jgi:hypothetical protein